MQATTTATPAAPVRSVSYRYDLDGLRGIAIVLVVVSHTWTLTEMPEGGLGRILMTSGNFAVAFFFVVSPAQRAADKGLDRVTLLVDDRDVELAANL